MNPPAFVGLFLITVMTLPMAAASLSGVSSSGSSSSSSKIARKNNSRKKVVIVGGTHGNEYTGVWCIQALERRQQQQQQQQQQRNDDALTERYPSLEIETLLGNPQAFRENKRFIDQDLNRQFSEEALRMNAENSDNAESVRARELNALLGPKLFDDDDDDIDDDVNRHTTDIIVDLHSTTTNMGLTLIIAEGDALMTAAAAYVMYKCGGGGSTGSNDDNHPAVRCLVHTHPSRSVRPNLSSIAPHGFTIEVGPVPTGVIRHDAVQKTQAAVEAFLEFLERRNNEQTKNNNEKETLQHELTNAYPSNRVPCFRSAPAVQPGEMSGKIPWPTHSDHENFPAYMIHESVQDRDFGLIRTGDPLFVDLDGNVIHYNGSHGDAVHLMFVNEAGYYFASSGTGIGVSLRAHFDLETGRLVQEEEEENAAADASALHEQQEL